MGYVFFLRKRRVVCLSISQTVFHRISAFCEETSPELYSNVKLIRFSWLDYISVYVDGM
jgi:hypothetical protein